MTAHVVIRLLPSLAAVLAFVALGAVAAADKPAVAEVPAELPRVPPVSIPVSPPENGNLEHDRPLFVHFAWQCFVALNGPSVPDDQYQRNTPDTRRPFGAVADRVVWESWKSLEDLYPADPRRNPPTKWESFPCRPADAGRRAEEALPRFNRLEHLNQTGLAPVAPVIDQNRKLVRFETRMNQPAYHHIFGKSFQYAVVRNAAAPEQSIFPTGSIIVRAAWKELSAAELKGGRFYTVKAKALVGGSNDAPVFEFRDFGLVGLHIVCKTRLQPDWIWATFEHVDNLFGETPAAGTIASFGSKALAVTDPAANKFTLNAAAMGPTSEFPKEAACVPVEVVRKDPIPPFVQDVSLQYRGHAQVRDTVWAHYRMVGVQWQSMGTRITDTTTAAANQRPATLANATLETYSQKQSCFSCHTHAGRYRDRNSMDLVFYPIRRAMKDMPVGP